MTDRAIRAKHWVLRHYLWVAIALLFLTVAVAFWMQKETWQTRLGFLAIPFVFFVGIQKQKTEELILFKELFEKFNKRYDRLNEDLNAIIAKGYKSQYSSSTDHSSNSDYAYQPSSIPYGVYESCRTCISEDKSATG